MASGLWGSLSACWDSVSAQLPVLGAQLGALQADFQRRLHTAGIYVGGSGEVLQLGCRRFRVLRKLGEGGYAFVFEVQEEVAPTTLGTAAALETEPLALKKVQCPGLCLAVAVARRHH